MYRFQWYLLMKFLISQHWEVRFLNDLNTLGFRSLIIFFELNFNCAIMILFFWVNVNKMNSFLIFFTNICIVNKIKKKLFTKTKYYFYHYPYYYYYAFFYINYEKGILFYIQIPIFINRTVLKLRSCMYITHPPLI